MKIVWKFPKFPIQYYWKQGVINVSLFSRRFFFPVPLPLRGLRLEHLQVLRCFFISFFSFFFYYFVTIRSLGNGTTKFPPRVLISRIHESESGVKIRKRAITRVTLSMISIVAPVVFHGIYSAIRV